jgi:hypothetical protein
VLAFKLEPDAGFPLRFVLTVDALADEPSAGKL